MTTAFEVAGDPDRPGPFVFTCEHASNALPPWLEANRDEAVLLADHWGWDVGARDVTLALVDRLGGQAVLAGFSRLVVDPNRAPSDATFIVRTIEGHGRLSFNAPLDAAEIERRTRLLFDPYHAAIDAALAHRLSLGSPAHLVSVHSFTAMYLGTPRAMQIGVLFDDFDHDAWRLQGALLAKGLDAALNAPYSGKPPFGLIYAAQRHGRRHGVKYLELEIRQDLIATTDAAGQIASRIAGALDSFRP